MTKPFLFQGTMLTIILLITVGCGSKIDSNLLYQKIKENQTEVFQTDSAAINKASTISLSLDNVFKDKITTNDPIIRRDNYLANFKVYKFQAPQDNTYKIVVQSYCDCAGFTKQIMDPTVTVLNPLRYKSEMKFHLFTRTFFEPLRFSGSDEFEILKDQTIFLLISSKNIDVGKEAVHFIDSKTLEKIKPGYKILRHPVGEINIKITQKP